VHTVCCGFFESLGKKNIFCHDVFHSSGGGETMAESFSKNKANIAAESNASDAYENSRRGDYLFIGFIGILLAGVIGYLVLNPDESTLRSGIKIEKSDANKVENEQVRTHAIITAPAKPEPAGSESAGAESEAAKLEAAKLEAAKLEAAKLEAAKLEATKLEATKPEVVKSEAVEQEVASAPLRENKSQDNNNVWAVNLVSFSSLGSAEKEMERLKAQGVVTEMVEVKIAGHTFYRVRISNLGSRKEAVSLRSEFGSRPEYEGVWISSYRK